MIYLDHNASTPALPETVEAMMPWLTEKWGNPSSAYRFGMEANKAVDAARESIASLVGSHPNQVVFTSGATEANNSALHASAFANPRKRHIVISSVEHSSILAYCDYLEKCHGMEVTRVPVDENGLLSLKNIEDAIRPDTAVVSLMWANNETGVIWDLSKISELCREREILFLTDAVQAIGKIPIKFIDLGPNFLSLSGHKIGAPKGIGALVVAEPDRFLPLTYGGKQENGLRGGTESVPLIVALGKAAEISLHNGPNAWKSIRHLRDTFEDRLLKRIPGAVINGSQSERISNTTNIHIPGMDGDAAVIFLDQKGICVSSGAACMESAITPSHVIFAMTGSHERASESLRISLSLKTRADDLNHLLSALSEFAAISI